MSHFENLVKSVTPTSADLSSIITDDAELLEKTADDMGGAAMAAAEILETDPSDDDSGIETLLTAPVKTAKP